MNAHPGNKRFRELIHLDCDEARKASSINCSLFLCDYILLLDSSFIFDIVATQVPCANEVRICPGGQDRAHEKALQALREGTAKLHKESEIFLFV